MNGVLEIKHCRFINFPLNSAYKNIPETLHVSIAFQRISATTLNRTARLRSLGSPFEGIDYPSISRDHHSGID